MKSIRHLLLCATAALLAACGGGGGDDPAPPPSQPVTFAFRTETGGAEQEFRYSTTSPEFITRARAQLLLPVANRKTFPAGAIAAGNGGVNLNWGWHFTDLSLVETAIELCDGTPAMVQADLNYWLNTVKRFCPWSGYVHSEVAADTTQRDFAIGQTREIASLKISIELREIVDTRCPAAAICVSAGQAEAQLLVRIGDQPAQPLTITLDAGARDRQAVLGGYRFTLDSLSPYPINDPIPKAQYRASVTVGRA